MRVFCLVLALAAASSSAQPGIRPAPGSPTLSLDVLGAIGDDFTTIRRDLANQEIGTRTRETVTAAVVLSGRFPLGPVTLELEAPFSYVDYFEDFGYSEVLREQVLLEAYDLSFGNPYIGLAMMAGPVQVSVGGRLPLADPARTDRRFFNADATIVATTLDPERYEAYATQTASVSLSGRLRQTLAPGLHADVRLSPLFLADLEDKPVRQDSLRSTSDFALGYGAQLTADVGPTALYGGVIGRQYMTSGRFDGATVDATVVLGATLVRARVQPGVIVRVPLTNDYGNTDATIGLSIDIPLRSSSGP